MQLAFFDIVVAGDKCTYETPYTKMGQVPEGYAVWNSLNKIRGSFVCITSYLPILSHYLLSLCSNLLCICTQKTKMFWLSEKVQSTEAALAGLVNKLTTGNKVNEEAINVAKKIASMSPEVRIRKIFLDMKEDKLRCFYYSRIAL